MIFNNREQIDPVMRWLGITLFSAQALESQLSLLHLLLDDKRDRTLTKWPAWLELPNSENTLGVMFKKLRERKYLIEDQKIKIRGAIRVRNAFIHSYWNRERTAALTTEAGRAFLVSDLQNIEKTIGVGLEVVHNLVEIYFREEGTSTAAQAKLFLEIEKAKEKHGRFQW